MSAQEVIDGAIRKQGGRRAAVVSAPPVAPDSAEMKVFQLLRADELHALPPPSWRIHSVIPASGVAAVFGSSTVGKSFLLLGMAAAGAAGGEWFGYRVKPGRWLYCALEGQAAFRQRVQAWEKHHERAFPDGVRFLFEAFRLTDRNDVLALAAAIDAVGGADVIVVDTLNRAAPDSDENTSADMGRILEAVRELQAMTASLVILTHHAGKDAGKGMRGHSSLFAALDAVIEVTRTDDRREWKVAKQKDGEEGAPHPFRLDVVLLGADEDGEPISSCVVSPYSPDDTAPRVRLPRGGNQKIVLDALAPLFRESSRFGRGGAPAHRPCITLDEAIAGCRDRLPVESKRRVERARQAITGLVALGALGLNEEWLWLR